MAELNPTERRRAIAELNDRVRRRPAPGEIVATGGVTALGRDVCIRLLRELATYASFDEGNDPYGEHDFGQIEIAGVRVFWKIDYCNLTLTGGCETPWLEDACQRVLTLMLAQEY